MWRGMTPGSILRVYLTVTGGSVSLRTSTCISFCKLLPENPTKDSRNSKEIQGVGSTLDFLEKS